MKEKILSLRLQGMSYKKICEKLRCSKSVVAYHATPNNKLNHTVRQRKRRQEFINLLKQEAGGKCSICGYDKNFAALDFHHTNPNNKDLSVSSILKGRHKDKVRQEAKKCILVCANCHREIHHPNGADNQNRTGTTTLARS